MVWGSKGQISGSQTSALHLPGICREVCVATGTGGRPRLLTPPQHEGWALFRTTFSEVYLEFPPGLSMCIHGNPDCVSMAITQSMFR